MEGIFILEPERILVCARKTTRTPWIVDSGGLVVLKELDGGWESESAAVALVDVVGGWMEVAFVTVTFDAIGELDVAATAGVEAS